MWGLIGAATLPLAAMRLTALGWVPGAAMFFLLLALAIAISSRQSNPGALRGKGALVVGAASGLGRELSWELARRGARLHLWDVNSDGLDVLLKQLRAAGCDATSSAVDITDANTLGTAAVEAERRFGAGGVELLINCAGLMNGSALATSSSRQPSVMDIHGVLNVNAVGALLVARAFLPRMLTRRTGLLCTVGSVMGFAGAAVSSTVAACIGDILSDLGARML